MPKVAARSLLGLWFLMAVPASNLHLCSLDICACSWALLWSHRLDLELVPGVGMEAVPTAASQVQAGATQGLVRTAPADEAAAVVVPE